MDEAPAVVVVGAASRDVDPAEPRGWRLGGGVSYSALTLARLGLRVGAVIGLDGPAAGADELDALREAGVAVHPARLARGPVYVNDETPTGRVQLVVERSDPIDPAVLPAAWRRAPGWLLAPVAAELPDGWAGVPPSTALVGLGWQGLLRDLEPGQQVRHRAPTPSPLLARADLVGVGRDDLDPTTGIDELAALLRPGATMLLTHGDRGGIALEIGADRRPLDRRSWPAIPVRRAVDPTGAGDVMLAGVLAARLEPRLVGGRIAGGWDLRLGAAAASLVCEGQGLAGVPTRDAVRRRLAEAMTPG